MSIENQPEYRAAVIQLHADGRDLDDIHRVTAERATCRIMALIADGVVKRVVRIDTNFKEPDYDEDQIS